MVAWQENRNSVLGVLKTKASRAETGPVARNLKSRWKNEVFHVLRALSDRLGCHACAEH